MQYAGPILILMGVSSLLEPGSDWQWACRMLAMVILGAQVQYVWTLRRG